MGFNAIAAWQKDGVSMARNGLLHGFDHSAWIVVVCNALNGLAISAVLKYADNIARVYAHAIAMHPDPVPISTIRRTRRASIHG